MPFQISPGVNVSEIDLTTIVPAVSTTEGAIGGVFRWGPIEEAQLVSSEDELVVRYGRPTSDNFETFFTAANFLAYGNKLYVSRAAASNAYNAFAGSNSSVAAANLQIKNFDQYGTLTLDANAVYYARYAGDLGNTLKISVCDSANAYSSTLTGNSDSVASIAYTINSNVVTVTVVSATSNTNANAMANSIVSGLVVGDYLAAGNSTVGTQYLKVTGIGAPASNATFANSTVNGAGFYINVATTYNLSQNVTSNSAVRFWEYFNNVDTAPGTSVYASNQGGSKDELHVVVVDEDGKITGNAGQVLEVWRNISRASDSKSELG
jgi:hypothetical protein